MSWYTQACAIIANQKRENPDLTPEQMKKFCSKNYPFGERKYHPYKMWLKAMKYHFGKSTVKKNPNSETHRSLFE